MNFFSRFTKQEAVAGLEITEAALRLALLELDKKTPGVEKIVELIEEPLPAGAIVEGRLADADAFQKALGQLLKKSRFRARYAIVSLPPDSIYTRVFFLPATVSEEKITETMDLIIDFQLPMKHSDSYIDWERTTQGQAPEVFLASIPKVVIDEYLAGLNGGDLKPIAAEFHPMSLARVIDAPADRSILIHTASGKSRGVFIIKNTTLRFSRILPEAFVPAKNLKAELSNISRFYEAEFEPLASVKELAKVKVVKEFAHDDRLIGDSSRWFISLGAARRGLVPRAHDTMVSLLPVGTETAYAYQKAITVAEFLAAVTIGLAIFFSSAFGLVWFIMHSIDMRTLHQFTQLTATVSISPEANAAQKKVKRLNDLLAVTSEIIRAMPSWSAPLAELRTRVTSGITISAVAAPAVADPLTVNGVAHNREQLNQFKKSLEQSSLFTDIQLPLTNLDKKENIPFVVSFRLKSTE